MNRIKLLIAAWLSALTRKLQNNFYLYLAVFLSVLVLLDAAVFHVGENMREKAFDLMVKNRVLVPKPDAQIVIIDINEASLAAMAPEYGRWPWPRQVFGEFLAHIQSQQPQAVVFDILFSDADVFQPDSDAYFNEVIAQYENTYFPFLRLPESQDKLSQVRLSQIPGVNTDPAQEADTSATVAVVLPHFEAALRAGRLGTHNIDPDKDGIVREYALWRTSHGWQIPALPLVVATEGKKHQQQLPQNMLINWRGKPFTYQFVSFSDVMADLGKKTPSRPQNEFSNKIVIIGSTAPSLFDLKATPMAKIHPGVEILATAIDNLKHADYLRVWRGALPYVLISLLLLWTTTLAFYRQVDRDLFNKVFSFSQIGLLLLSYLAINLTNTYLDFAGPITWAVAYFSVAKIYAMATERAMQKLLAFDQQILPGSTRASMVPIQIEADEPLGDAMLKQMKRLIEQSLPEAHAVEIMRGSQSGIWGLFVDTIVITWLETKVETANDTVSQPQQEATAAGLARLHQDMPKHLKKIGLPANTPWFYASFQAQFQQDQALDSQWRILFARAMLALEADKLSSLNSSNAKT